MSARAHIAVAAATAALLVLSGCAADTSADSGSASGETVITHAFGETVVPAEADSVVTLGWGATDAALALGVVPVAIEAQSYGGNADGVLPWVEEKLDELGADAPVVVPSSSEEPAYEDIAAVAPDLILAPYSGVTEEQYELLSEIAPTVVYPGEAWSTPWREVIDIVGAALHKEDEAAEVVEGIESTIADAAAANPEFAGKSIAAVWDVGGTFYVYKAADPRVEFLFDLGFVNAPAVDELANGDATFYYTLSYEQLDQLDSDVVVVYSDSEEELATFLAQPYAQSIPAVQSGAVAGITSAALVASVSPPTALSLTWGLDDFVASLSSAAAAAK